MEKLVDDLISKTCTHWLVADEQELERIRKDFGDAIEAIAISYEKWKSGLQFSQTYIISQKGSDVFADKRSDSDLFSQFIADYKRK